eukprot:TRINITY_DN448_c0_g1_i1.p1 TRINITY_DN448_c0_g1~~TRINITY_DN448_c0_g1_i1.p1  ORF type:complete len:273 (+),score=59.46 TRINITY_DN448_c0_g1_i1:37-855(+)
MADMTTAFIMLPAVYLLRQMDLEEPNNLFLVRCAFGLCQLVAAGVLFLVWNKIKNNPNDTKIKVKQEAKFGELPGDEMEEVTVTEYDTRELKNQVKQLFTKILIISAIHYKWGVAIPLALQLIHTPLTIYKDKLTRIHLFGETGPEFKRPFPPPPSPFSGFTQAMEDMDPNKKKSKKLTPEELEQRRLAMEQDAEQVQKQRIEKVMKYTEEESKERQNYLTTEQKTGLGPSFLNSMGKEVYEDKTTASLEDRVKRGRHYVQKTNLDERGMFN